MRKENVHISGFVRLSTALNLLQKNLERVKSDRVQALNLKNGEVLMMYMLYDNCDGLSAEQLSRACHLDRSLISRSVQSLHEKQLIVYPSIPEGKRRYGTKLQLSEQGQKIGEIIDRYAHNVQAFLDEGVPPEHLQIMYATLNKLCARFEELNQMDRSRLVEIGLLDIDEKDNQPS